MSIKISEAIGFFSKRINIGQFFGREEEDVYITMNEPDEDDQMKLSDNKDEIKKIWKKYLDPEKHNFVYGEKQDDGTEIEKPAKKEQIIPIISKKGFCLIYILGQWYDTLPLARKTGEK